MKFLCHVHTSASYDSITSPKRIIDHCKHKGITLVAISDHESMKHVTRAKEYGEKEGVRVIPAVEWATVAGDLIGLFAKRPPKGVALKEVVDDFRQQGALVLLPHPYSHHKLDQISPEHVDIVEIFNPRIEPKLNELALQWATKERKPQFAGADAHLPWELGNAINHLMTEKMATQLSEEELKSLLLQAPRTFETRYSAPENLYASQVIKGMKQRNLRLIRKNLYWLSHHLGRRLLGRS